MSKNGTRKKKEKGILRHFFPGRDKPEAAVPEAAQPSAAPVESEPVKEEVPAVEIPVGACLKKAFEKWKGAGVSLCVSFAVGSAPLDSEECLTEAQRLSAALEKDAEEYLQALERWEAAHTPNGEDVPTADGETAEDAPPDGGAESNDGRTADTAPSGDDAPTGAMYCTYVSQNGMAAWMLMFPPFVPQALADREAISHSLEQSGVTTGIDETAIEYLCREQPYFELTLIARGTPTEEGTDGSVRELYPRQLSDEVNIDDSGTADYYTKNFTQPIKKDDVICELVPPREGTAGVRVDGRAVPPRPVTAAKLTEGANTVLSEDRQRLLAKIDGHLEYRSGFLVRSSLTIDGDIDFSTGNIDYQGDVHISGSVRAGFSVRATGTVAVDGMVESGSIEAGGDVLVTSGILGGDRAVIKSGGTVRAKFIENGTVFAAVGIYTDCAVASRLGCDQNIVVTTGRGTVIGGTVTAGKKIKAHIIGSTSGRRTDLVLGTLPYTMREREDCEKRLEKLGSERQKLETEIQGLRSRAEAKDLLSKANLRRSVLVMKEKRLEKQLLELEGTHSDVSACRLECTRVFPVTQLTVRDTVYTFEDVKNNCIATFDKQSREVKFH